MLRLTWLRTITSKTTGVLSNQDSIFFMRMDVRGNYWLIEEKGTNESIDLDKFDQIYHLLPGLK
jgi:hypothetical protein